MRLYVTATFKGTDNRAEIEALCALVDSAGWESFCFVRDVEQWGHVFDDPVELMRRSLREIMRCDALLLDLTTKPTGRALEAGMAYATGRRVIRHRGAWHANQGHGAWHRRRRDRVRRVGGHRPAAGEAASRMDLILWR